jgi:hypothetical protein
VSATTFDEGPAAFPDFMLPDRKFMLDTFDDETACVKSFGPMWSSNLDCNASLAKFDRPGRMNNSYTVTSKFTCGITSHLVKKFAGHITINFIFQSQQGAMLGVNLATGSADEDRFGPAPVGPLHGQIIHGADLGAGLDNGFICRQLS